MAEDRDAILARRKFLIASAIAGITASGCSKPEAPPEPQVCLKVAIPAERERPGKGQPDPQAGDAAPTDPVQASDAGAGDAAPPKPSR